MNPSTSTSTPPYVLVLLSPKISGGAGGVSNSKLDPPISSPPGDEYSLSPEFVDALAEMKKREEEERSNAINGNNSREKNTAAISSSASTSTSLVINKNRVIAISPSLMQHVAQAGMDDSEVNDNTSPSPRRPDPLKLTHNLEGMVSMGSDPNNGVHFFSDGQENVYALIPEFQQLFEGDNPKILAAALYDRVPENHYVLPNQSNFLPLPAIPKE